MAHQVDSTSEAEEKPGLERQQSAKSRVSFDQPEAGQQAAAGDRKDSFTGVTRVSFEKPADLYVTSAPATAEQAKAAEPEAKVEASNTGTAKRKSKKKRDEVGVRHKMLILLSFPIFLWFLLPRNNPSIHQRISFNSRTAKVARNPSWPQSLHLTRPLARSSSLFKRVK